MATPKEKAAARPDEDEEERVGLRPFTFEEVLAGVLAVDPKDLPEDEEPEHSR